MIELQKDQLVFRFPEVHPKAVLSVEFQRTLRIPDDDRIHHLPPGLGRFPVRHVDDFADAIPEHWAEHGGVMLPMYQSEALWVLFHSSYPFAVRIAAGKIDAITGKTLKSGLARRPQNYMVTPDQPWLDGYCVEKGVIRQFVAMPLGAGYSAEEQITGTAEFGGLQVIAHPMAADAYERMRREESVSLLVAQSSVRMLAGSPMAMDMDMGLAPGGRMQQDICHDPHHLEDWDQDHSSRCFVHLANSLVWRQVTGEAPPTVPPTAKEYTDAGLPWYDYYSDGAAVGGSSVLNALKSVVQMGKAKGEKPLPENQPVHVANVVALRQGLGKNEVREGTF